MEPTIWEKILLAFRYNDSLWHNIFLTIIYALLGIAALLALSGFMRALTRPRDIRDDAPPRRNPLRVLLNRLFGTFMFLIFPVGLFLLLTVMLGSSDSASIESGTLAYEQDGTEMSVVIVDKFIANSHDRGVTSGTSKAFVYAINAQTGEPVWKTSIGRAYSPFLLGQTDKRIALFDGSGPVVLDKADGAELADAAKLEASNAQSKAGFPKEAGRYKWDEKLKAIIFQGLDGGLYALDPDKLNVESLPSSRLSAYFGSEAAPTYTAQRLGLIRSGAGDGKYALFLNERQADLLKKGTFGQEDESDSGVSDPRMQLYKGTLLKGGGTASKDLKPLTDEIFLNGGFLSALRTDDSTAKDPYRAAAFADYEKVVKEPQAPGAPESIDWPSRMTVEQYERYKAEEKRRSDAYYAERDRYDAQNETYRAQRDLYTNTARALLWSNSGSEYPPFHYSGPSGQDVFLIVHDKTAENSSDILISAFDLKAGQVLWTVDTRLWSVDSYDVAGGYLSLIGKGAQSNSYLFSLSLEDGSAKGYDFRYDRSLTF
ncbi:PA2928 family protein [Saccharibacillus alkalitolerans]|uniref:Pyrroloquinoline-quinone binding quinoprotein n=1 Tax=Saccharibacillus alkalitolerans TaxID=2705290 RepID=A0ABX0F535_9BACL|nr:PA2928 family protein [Saccharibacillus alkalitolerans]NGZ76066.1 hypothetical protein [Saccharibacillus alkalitolerans]